MAPSAPAAIEKLLGAKEIVIVCGPGGVGKTTTAAALATAAAARTSARVLVLTVDPARRLADALGLDALDNSETRIDPALFKQAAIRPKGELYAAMLDTSRAWDALIERFAPSSSVEQILANPFYRNVTGRFAHSHEYIAMERLYELHVRGEYDLLVIDTPPSQSALDFLDAPQKMNELFSSRVLRWLGSSTRSRLFEVASRPFFQIAGHVLGDEVLNDIAGFLSLFQGMYPGFIERSKAVSSLIRDSRTTFMVVTTLERGPFDEARRLLGALDERHVHVGLLVANKILASSFGTVAGVRLAEAFEQQPSAIAAELVKSDEALGDAEQIAKVLAELGHSYANFHLVANREAELFEELSGEHEVRALVPHLMGDVIDLPALLDIGTRLFDASAQRP
jgi:anion-transporting  ArsA/GET3 family ATPase